MTDEWKVPVQNEPQSIAAAAATMVLPPAEDLVAEVRRDGPGVLDAYVPAIDQLADAPQIAGWLGIQARTIYRERSRQRDGRPAWPDPEPLPGRSPLWKWRTIVLHRAASPGPGNRLPRVETAK